jgi:hypothetical protein
MRNFVLIAAFILASATAQAGTTRGLTLASSDDAAVAVEQPSGAPKTADTPAGVVRPAAVDTSAQAAQPDHVGAAPAKKVATAAAVRPKHRHQTTEARVISELHRHGIFW